MPASTSQSGILQFAPQGGIVPPLFGPTHTGNIFFVNAGQGSDGNAGNTPSQPLATLAGALARCVSGNNDCIFLIGQIAIAATILWNLNQTHLFGCNAPTMSGQQARIIHTGAALVTPLVQVTGSGCHFENFAVLDTGSNAAAAVCWQESSQRNSYRRVQFGGMGNAAGSAAQAASRHLLIDGGAGQATPTTGLGDNFFEECRIGVIGVQRSAANANLEIQNASPNNHFRRCVFVSNTSAATALFMTLGASAIDGATIFEGCMLINNTKAASGVAMTQSFAINATQTGVILFKDSHSVGATKLETTATNYVFVTEPAVSATAGAYAINNT